MDWEWLKPSLQSSFWRLLLALLLAAVLVGLLIMPFLAAIGGMGILFAFVLIGFMRLLSGLKTSTDDIAAERRAVRHQRARRRAQVKADFERDDAG